MENIAKQLNDEIQSLDAYIGKVERRYLAEHWAAELLGPLEEVEDELDDEDLVEALIALVTTRDRYQLDGSFSARLDALLQRHPELLGKIVAGQEANAQTDAYEVPVAARQDEPQTAEALFEEEDEEFSPAESFDEEEEEGPDPSAEEELFEPAERATDAPETAVPENPARFEPIVFATDTDDDIELDIESDDLVSGDELFKPVNVDPPATEAPPPPQPPRPAATPPPADAPSPGELFNTNDNEIFGDGTEADTADRIDARTRRMPRSEPRDSGRPNRLGATGAAAKFNPLAGTVGLDELQERMSFSLTRQDISQLQMSLQEQANGRKINALKTDEASAGCYLLIPRVSRFFHGGKLLECTVKNLAKTYFEHFSNIQELTQYRNFPLLTSEVPETGWALVPPECLSDSLGKNYMEQMQFLRQLASRVGLPSHLVRRRTLVEAVYDILVGKLAMRREVLRQTVDWTSSGPSKNDFICVYNADLGIRLRDLSRTSHHRAMGLCPNW